MKVALIVFGIGGLLAWLLWRSRRTGGVSNAIGPAAVPDGWGRIPAVPSATPAGVKAPTIKADRVDFRFGLGGVTGVTLTASGEWMPGPNDAVRSLPKTGVEGQQVTWNSDGGVANSVANAFGGGNYGDKYTYINGAWVKGYWKNVGGQWVGAGKNPGDPWSEGKPLTTTAASDSVAVYAPGMHVRATNGVTYTKVDGTWVKGYWGQTTSGQWRGMGEHAGDPWSKGQPLTDAARNDTATERHYNNSQGTAVYDIVADVGRKM